MRRAIRISLLPLAFLALSASGADTLKIVGIMMTFQRDAIGDQTTGKGSFGSDPEGHDFTLDPLPHNKAYFEKHLEFARNYFFEVSKHRLVIDYAVFDDPRDLLGKLITPRQMSHYRPPAKKKRESFDEYYFRLNAGLMAFSRDALRAAADTNILDIGAKIPKPNPSDTLRVDSSTVFVMFYAGAWGITDGGALGSLGADTPSDLVHSFIAPEDFQCFQGSDYDDGVSVEPLRFDSNRVVKKYGIYSRDSSNFIAQLLICPETASQDGLNFGTHGILINQIGRVLGLPDLWDIKTGFSAAGSFCLMDFAGYNTYQGFIPILPSAWCRVKLGWNDPRVLEADSFFKTIDTVYSEFADSTKPRILKIPLSSTEYFLIENRQYLPQNAESLVVSNGQDTFSYGMYDTLNGGPQVAMLFDTICADPHNCDDIGDPLIRNPKKAKGVVTWANTYDAGLPGFGALLWHVDEAVINPKLAPGKTDCGAYMAGDYGINTNIDRRGVDLEEADGIEDIGIEFKSFFGSAFLYGGPEDFYPHYEFGTGQFISQITPYNVQSDSAHTSRFFSTHTNTGAYTGITITIDTLGMGAKRKPSYANTAAFFLKGEGALPDSVGLFASDKFRVIVQWALGQGTWPQPTAAAGALSHLVSVGPKDHQNIYAVTGAGRIFGYAPTGKLLRVDTLSWKGLSSPTVSDSFMVFAAFDSTGQKIVRYRPSDGSDTALFSLGGDTVSTPIAVTVNGIYFGTRHGRVWKLGAGAPVSRTLDSTGAVTALAVDSARVWAACRGLYRLSATSLAVGKQVPLSGITGSDIRLAVGDISQRSPGLETVVNDNRGHVLLLDSALHTLSGWPAYIATHAAVSPALGDVDGDGSLDIVIPGDNTVHALSYTGTPLTRWPLTVAAREPVGQLTSTASLTDIDGNGDMEIFVPAPNGNILILDGDARDYEFTVAGKPVRRALSFGGAPGPSCVVRNIDVDANSSSGVPEHIEIFTLGANGYLSCFNIELKSDSVRTAWETEGGTLSRSFVYAGPPAAFTESVGKFAVDTLFTWPNPTRGSVFTVKYRLSRSARTVRVKMFNAAGDRILEKSGLPGQPLWNHYAIDAAKIAPGMYLLKLEAEGAGGKTHKFTKVGILK